MGDGAKTGYKMRYGAGQYSTFDSTAGNWADNACAEAVNCKIKGKVFVASFGPNVFTYDRSTGRYILADIFGDITDRGKCTPE